MDYEEKIDAILDWADERDRGFDTMFVEELKGNLDVGLTKSQEQAIDNIIERWHIDIDAYGDEK